VVCLLTAIVLLLWLSGCRMRCGGHEESIASPLDGFRTLLASKLGGSRNPSSVAPKTAESQFHANPHSINAGGAAGPPLLSERGRSASKIDFAPGSPGLLPAAGAPLEPLRAAAPRDLGGDRVTGTM
jgi:hypothetical protein